MGRWIWLEALPTGLVGLLRIPGGNDLAGEFDLYTLVGAFLSPGSAPDRDRPALSARPRRPISRASWNESRRRIERILTMDESDADALMQLGTLYVRTNSANRLARRTFRQCLESHGGAKWRWEIQQISGSADAKDEGVVAGADRACRVARSVLGPDSNPQTPAMRRCGCHREDGASTAEIIRLRVRG